jgi:transposase
MYIRHTTRTVRGKSYVNHLLVESVATPEGPRQRVVCSLGDLSPRPASEWLKLAYKIEMALVGQGDLLEEPDGEAQVIVAKVRRRQARRSSARSAAARDEDLVSVHTDRVTMEEAREAGAVHVGWQFCQRLGLEQILAEAGLSDKARRLSVAMILNRLIAPASEHAMPDWVRRTALADLLDVDFSRLEDQALYRNLDRLYPNRARIESALVERERDLFGLDTTVYLYDLTSTYFEGQALLNPKAKRGTSRDSRPDAKQVVVGLVVNRDGFPLAHEVWAGNTQDRLTVGAMLDVLAKRVDLKPGQTVVVDRGMAYDEDLSQIAARRMHWLVAARQAERDALLAEFEDLDGFEEIVREPSPTNPAQKKSRVRVKQARRGETTLALCLSQGREGKDRAIRDKHEKRLLADVARLQTSVANGRLKDAAKINERIGRLKERYPRVARYYRLAYDAAARRVTCEPDEEKRQKAQALDGAYILKTDRDDLTAEEIWRIYILLTRAENAFRCMKSPLAERPIFHHLEHRVDTHIFLCVLAYHLLVAIEKTLLDQGVHTSWATMRETLKTHQIATLVLPTDQGMTLKIRRPTTPEAEHLDLYRRLAIPSEIIRPRKTWVLQGAADSD